MSDLSIMTAVRDLLLPITRPDASHLIRQTTLAADTVPGSGAVSLTSAAGFAVEGLLLFDDALGEEPLSISSLSGNTVNLDSAGTGATGPRFVHPAGTVVYTNLTAYTPWDVAAMLDGGDPAIFVTVLREYTDLVAMPNITQGVYSVHLQYHRLLVRNGGASMPPNVWAYRQERSARADLGLIRTTLLGNQELITSRQSAQALKFAAPGSGNHLCQTDWGKTQVDRDTWHFVATLDAIVTGIPE